MAGAKGYNDAAGVVRVSQEARLAAWEACEVRDETEVREWAATRAVRVVAAETEAAHTAEVARQTTAATALRAEEVVERFDYERAGHTGRCNDAEWIRRDVGGFDPRCGPHADDLDSLDLDLWDTWEA